MSAAVGLMHLNGRPATSFDVAGMLETLSYRGPDGTGVECQGTVACGHLMLHTTPESLHEVLPLRDESRDLILTADARIDNRDELIEALGFGGPEARQLADSELILAAYVKWGEKCPSHLLGDFVFAIWDGRHQKLFCARDHLGVKPFYYHFTPGKIFAFSTDIKGLLCLPEVPRRINELRIGVFLTTVVGAVEDTYYQDVFRLPAAHTLTVHNGQMRLSRYWQLESPPELKLGSDEEYAEAFREQFFRAVDCRLRSAFPVASALSGGLDSSSIVCTARQLLAGDSTRPLHTFSGIFPGLPETHLRYIDEREYVQAVVSGGGFESHLVRADLLSPLGERERVMNYLAEPFYNPSLYIHWACHQGAHNVGARVFLEGFDGDSAVNHGYNIFLEMVGKLQLVPLVREARALARRYPWEWSTRNVIWDLGLRRALGALLLDRFQKSDSIVTPHMDGLVNPEFASQVGLQDYLRKESPVEPWAWTVRREHVDQLASKMEPFIMELSDREMSAFQMEPRYPFMDIRLLRLCTSLPANQKLQQGWTRYVLRRAMEGVLPPKVQWRLNKARLGPNFFTGLLEKDIGIFKDLLADDDTLKPYVNQSVLALAAEGIKRPYSPGESSTEIPTLYALANLHQWLKRESALPGSKAM